MPFLVPTNPVITVSGTIPVISTGGNTPVISIQDATVEQKGAVQLEDSISSDSVTKAATPKSVKEVYDYATTIDNALSILFGRHTLESGDSLTIEEGEQKLNHGAFVINGTGSLTVNGSGQLCIIGG